jgi:hypothetical protein
MADINERIRHSESRVKVMTAEAAAGLKVPLAFLIIPFYIACYLRSHACSLCGIVAGHWGLGMQSNGMGATSEKIGL